MTSSGEYYGLHRVVKPQGRAPQGAFLVKNEPRLLSPYEALLDVELLNLDATSMKQIRTEHKDDVTAIKQAILATIKRRGKMHNETTNSGGVLVGRVKEVGALSPYKSLPVGTKIIPLCSLTAIPLYIESIGEVHEEQVTVQGKAIVFPCYKFTVVPNDFPLKVALSCVDVSRLVPQVERLVRSKPGANIVILGAGKAGLLTAVATRYFDPKANIIVFDFKPQNLEVAKSLGVANAVARVDCRDVKAMMEAMSKYLISEGADFVFNCVNVEGTETPSSLAVKQGGTLVYFSMATSFGSGVLSTDGTGKDINVVMGAGVYPDQAEKAFALLNHNHNLKKYFYEINSESLPEPSPELWRPSQERTLNSNLVAFAQFLEKHNVLRLRSNLLDDPFSWYRELHSWSVTSNAEFWGWFWKFLGIKAFREPNRIVSPGAKFQETKFFSGALVNHAKTLLYQVNSESLGCSTAPDERIALIWNGEDPKASRLEFTYGQLRREVKQLAMGLKALGIKKGDRVASLLPNIPYCVIAMLATTAIGAIWTSCSPDVGTKVAFERFGRVEPVALFTTEHFSYNGKIHSTQKVVQFMAEQIPDLKVIAVPHLFPGEIQFANIKGSIQYADILAKHQNVDSIPEHEWIVELPVDHPVYILYTSGTTGPPKCITQGYGVTLNHLKETVLHCDIKPGETAFVYTNTGWMIWHWFISLLGTGCTLVLFDGSPFFPEPMALWRMIDREEVSYFGLSSRYLAALEKANVKPKEELGLSKLRLITATGSPLSVSSSYYVYREIKTDIHLASITGGTEINGCLALAVSVLPVYPAQLQGPGLGMDVTVVDFNGRDVVDVPGELAVRNPFPSMPVKFWGDEDGSRYHKAYFAEIPGLWVHGDHAQRTRDGGFFVFGRSDATLNPGGVRLGTADYYNVVETVQGVEDCLVVGRTINENEVVVLFAKFSPGVDVAETKKKIFAKIRHELSPKHIPAEIVKVSEIPYNINFKKMEILVKKLIDGQDVSPFTSTLQNPQCLEEYHAWVKSATGQQAKL